MVMRNVSYNTVHDAGEYAKHCPRRVESFEVIWGNINDLTVVSDDLEAYYVGANVSAMVARSINFM